MGTGNWPKFAGIRDDVYITLTNLNIKLNKIRRDLSDLSSSNAQMRHVAKLYLAVVNFLHEDFQLQGMPFPANFGQLPVPITDDYFQYDSEEFAVAAGGRD